MATAEETNFLDSIGQFITANADAISAVAAVIVIVGAFVLFSWKHIVAFGALVFRVFHQRVRSHNVVSTQGNLFDDFIEVYHSTFGPKERVSTEEIQDWISRKSKDYDGHYVPVVCYSKGRAAGFAIVWANAQRDILFIAYLGVAPGFGWRESRSIMTCLRDKILRSFPHWRIIVTEMESPSEAGISVDERRRRSARIRHLRSLSNVLGLKLASPQFEYVQPTFATDEEDEPPKLMQLHMAFHEEKTASIDRAEIIRCLRFLYIDVYLPCAPSSVSDAGEYSAKLEEELLGYHGRLAPLVPLTH